MQYPLALVITLHFVFNDASTIESPSTKCRAMGERETAYDTAAKLPCSVLIISRNHQCGWYVIVFTPYCKLLWKHFLIVLEPACVLLSFVVFRKTEHKMPIFRV